MKSVQELREVVKDKLLLSVTQDSKLSDREFKSLIDELIKDECKDALDRSVLVKKLFQSIRQYDVIQDLIEDDEITEIMINGYDSIFIEKNGQICKSNIEFESHERLCDVIQKMVSKVNRIVNESNPIVDARLQDGSRINVVLPPVALEGPIVTIRKFPKTPLTMNKLVELDAISNEAVELLGKLVKARYNIFISGGTGSGKTTFLNALSEYIPKDERIITIEDVAEIQLQEIPNLVRLEVRNANVEGNNEVSVRELIKTALRMNPSRILLGECRGEEAVDLLTAYNTGHDGSISTGHANSARDMLSRLESMVLMGAQMPISVIKSKIASAIDIVVHLMMLPNKKRCVYEISEVIEVKDGEIVLNKLYEYKNGLVRTSNQLVDVEKLERAGMMAY